MNKKTQKVFNIIAEVISEETGLSMDNIGWDTVISQEESVRKKIVERLTVSLRNAVLAGKFSTVGELIKSISFWN